MIRWLYIHYRMEIVSLISKISECFSLQSCYTFIRGSLISLYYDVTAMEISSSQEYMYENSPN